MSIASTAWPKRRSLWWKADSARKRLQAVGPVSSLSGRGSMQSRCHSSTRFSYVAPDPVIHRAHIPINSSSLSNYWAHRYSDSTVSMFVSPSGTRSACIPTETPSRRAMMNRNGSWTSAAATSLTTAPTVSTA